MILQKIVFAFRALINSRIASTLNFKKKIFVILIEIFILGAAMYHKYTLTYQKDRECLILSSIQADSRGPFIGSFLISPNHISVKIGS
jgi:hypothetical protein